MNCWKLTFCISLLSGCSTGDSSVPFTPPAPAVAAGEAVTTVNAPEETLNQDFHFGNVAPQATLNHRFQLTNDSTSLWTISNVAASCSCTVATLSQHTLQPGEAVSIDVTFNPPANYNDGSSSVTVYCDQRKAPIARLRLSASVRPSMTVQPSSLQSIELAPDSTSNRTLTITNYSDGLWAGLDVDSLPAWIDVNLSPVPFEKFNAAVAPARHARQAWRVDLKLSSAALAPGMHETDLKFTSRSEPAEEYRLPVRVVIRNHLTAIPDKLALGAVSSGETVHRTLVLALSEVAASQQDQLAFASTLGDSIAFGPRVANGRFVTIPLTFHAPGHLSGPITGQLEIQVSDSDLPRLTVPVSGLITAP